MRITGNDGNMNIQAAYTQTASRQFALGAQETEKVSANSTSFDQVKISGSPSGESKFQKELAARLVQDVRAASSTGAIQQLRGQVRAGTYQINPAAIASAMLLEG